MHPKAEHFRPVVLADQDRYSMGCAARYLALIRNIDAMPTTSSLLEAFSLRIFSNSGFLHDRARTRWQKLMTRGGPPTHEWSAPGRRCRQGKVRRFQAQRGPDKRAGTG